MKKFDFVFIFVGVIIGFIIISLLYSFFNTNHLYNTNEGLEGLDLFYTNTSFERDLLNFKEIYYENYNVTEEGNPKWIIFNIDNIDPPINLYLNRSFNCEDASHTVYQLMEKYGIECRFYEESDIMYNYSYDFLFSSYKLLNKWITNHMGVECYYEDEWNVLI